MAYSKTVHWTVLEDIAYFAKRGKTLVFPLHPFSALLRYSVLRTELLRASAQSSRTSCGGFAYGDEGAALDPPLTPGWGRLIILHYPHKL